MKDQYVGDINDYRKYGLLRMLAAGGKLRLGVCWMLTTPDGRSDGLKVKYLEQPHSWRDFDLELFDLLKSVIKVDDGARLSMIEKGGVILGAMYQNDLLTDNKDQRQKYLKEVWRRFEEVDIVFFDPDNGIEVPSKPKSRKGSSKYIYWDEIIDTYKAGHSVLIYQHFPRKPRDAYIKQHCDEMIVQVKPKGLWTFRTPHVVFFLLGQPQHTEIIDSVFQNDQGSWHPQWLTVLRHR